MPHLALNRSRFLTLILVTIAVMFPIGANAQQQPQQSPPITPEATYDDWAKACQTPPSGSRECFVFQNITTQEGGRPMLQLTIVKVPDAQRPVLLLTVPLGVLLPQGLSLSIDGSKPSRIPIQICLPNGCQTQFEIPEPLLSAFKAGLKGSIKIFNPTGQEVNIPFSLKGFTKALDSLG